MEIYTIEILEPKAIKLLENLADLNLIKFQEVKKKSKKARKFGSMKGLVKYIAEDFNESPNDFDEYK